MFDKIEELEIRYQELESLLSDPAVIANQPEFRKLSREHNALTGLIGYSWASPWLVYFQGGAVWSRVEADINAAVPAGVFAASFSDTKTGWTVGGGVEYRFAPQWSVFVEGNYYDFGSRDRIVFTPTATACQAGCLFSGKTTAVSVLAGVNYRFWGGM